MTGKETKGRKVSPGERPASGGDGACVGPGTRPSIETFPGTREGPAVREGIQAVLPGSGSPGDPPDGGPLRFLVRWKDLSGTERFSLIGAVPRTGLMDDEEWMEARSQKARLHPIGRFRTEEEAALFLESSGKTLSELPPARNMSLDVEDKGEMDLRETWVARFRIDPLSQTGEELEAEMDRTFRNREGGTSG